MRASPAGVHSGAEHALAVRPDHPRIRIRRTIESARFGRDAENAAAAYLGSLGYRIVTRNLRGPGGEIDIVATDGPTVVFIEVKARRSRNYGSALGAVDARKRHRLRAIAADYLQFYAPHARARFDVLSIDGNRLRLHRDAF